MAVDQSRRPMNATWLRSIMPNLLLSVVKGSAAGTKGPKGARAAAKSASLTAPWLILLATPSTSSSATSRLSSSDKSSDGVNKSWPRTP